MNNTSKSSLVAERALSALMLFASERSLTVSDVANGLNISLTSAYRLVEALNNTGFIKREESKKYILNPPNILKLYNMVEQDLRKIAKPYMQKLAKEFQESVYLSVMYSDQMTYSFVEKEESSITLKWAEKLGYVYKLPTGTAGKTHLAYFIKQLNLQERAKVLAELELDAHTKNSITTIEALEKSLEGICEKGYCFTNSEHVQGAIGIAVPIFNASNDATVAVLSVFMAETNFKENQLDYYLQKLKSNAQNIGNSIL
ncbi:hypothetical protein ABE61_01880 [Lysinibacillus sphaericus]|uniref:IclR family transcriptional regulator n=1 Tax=Lysinibacillus sphaericus TaxID=1421 RepID=UPI0018CD8ADC|nr:IclR family transcriptional regulator [Lysinibacillus sphaericus]MBG9452867.1 hypothetical protein [Lysinibacillus sphaericus]MBG9480074.1 hypothetical protein [Lysinibacillus sphaericus]MBG9593734.1 hypothetical protein [Lysinibacillus sphaericus]